MKRLLVLYIVTLIVLVPLDFLFLGVFARDFFKQQVGDMLGEFKLLPGVIFYIVYTIGILLFVSSPATANVRHTLVYGALFGFFAYATFDLTCLAVLRHWSWIAAFADVTWGAFVTATSATAGLLAANWLAAKV